MGCDAAVRLVGFARRLLEAQYRLAELLRYVIVADARCGRAQQQRCGVQMCQLGGESDGLVMRRLFLLVGRFVRLVDDDKADTRGRERTGRSAGPG
jgi:hypothetical protein